MPFLCVVCCLLHILNNVDFEYFGLAHPHGKNLLFKLTFSLLVQHLIPYYAEIFLASSLSPLHKCSCAALGSVSLAGSMKDTAGSQLPFMCYIRVSMRPHRKSDLRAPLKCFHLLCQNNLDPSVISEFLRDILLDLLLYENTDVTLASAQARIHIEPSEL